MLQPSGVELQAVLLLIHDESIDINALLLCLQVQAAMFNCQWAASVAQGCASITSRHSPDSCTACSWPAAELLNTKWL